MNQIHRPAPGRRRRPIAFSPSVLTLGFSLLALLALTGCGSKKSDLPVFRLIDNLDKVEFQASPFPELVPAGKSLAPKDKIKKILDRRKLLIESLLEPLHWAEMPVHPMTLKFTKNPVRKPEVGHRTKNVLLAPPNTVFRIQRTIASGSVLEFGLGVLNHNLKDLKGGIRFRLLASDASADKPRVLYWRILQPGIQLQDRRWIHARVDLKDFTGKTVWLTFETSEKKRGETSPPFIGAWVNPMILEKPAAPKLNVILISLDTLRADHLSCYGYQKPTSPHLDDLARQGVRFKNAISQAPYTLSSHMSIMTSLYPSFHGVNSVEYGEALAEGIPTLADLFYRQGYRTWAITGGGQLNRYYGFFNGFETHTEYANKVDDCRRKVEETIAFLENHKDDNVFVFFHAYAAHAPYLPQPPYTMFVDPNYEGWVDGEKDTIEKINNNIFPVEKKDIEHLIALYDGKIREADESIGRLADYLKKSGLDQRTLIVITADHGEEFLEHSKIATHSHTLYDELLRVPLIFRGPGIPARVSAIEEQVRSIDILPTILGLAQIDSGPAKFQGQSLLPLIEGMRNHKVNPYAFSERLPRGDMHWRSVRTSRYKFILLRDSQDKRNHSYFFFDLLRDPGEHNSLVLSTVRRKAWEHKLDFLVKANRRSLLRAGEKKRMLDSETLETLRALGYVR